MKSYVARYTFNPVVASASALGIVLSAIAMPALAQDDNRRVTALEEVIVTAQRREESLQDAPISVAALDQEKLEAMGFSDIGDLQNNVPNLSMREMPSSKTSVRNFIRGVGNNDVQITQDPAVGVYLDGVYIARSTGLIMDITDVERVEVLRGPQGTLYGRNATGGTINIVSRKPSEEFGFRQKFTVGNYSAWRSETSIDLGAWNNFSSSVTFVTGETDGWVENKGAGVDPNQEERTAYRVALRYTPTEAITVDYSFDHSEMDYGTIFYQTLDQPYAGTPYTSVPYSEKRQDSFTPSEPFEESSFEIDGHSLVIEWALSDGLVIKSLTGYRELEEQLYQDYSPNPFVAGLFQNNPFDTEQDQFSQEIQFSGTFDHFDYIAGLYYFEEEGSESTTDYIALEVPPFVPFGKYQLASRETKAENEAKAVFGQVSYRPDDSLTLTLGVRYTEDERKVTGSRGPAFDTVTFTDVTASDNWSNTSATAIADYQVADNQSIYLKFAQGYRTGGFNARANRAAALVEPIDEETLESWEIGYKSEWGDRRVRFNAAIFKMDYEDIQLSFANPMDVSDVRFFNAGTAEIEGFEMDLTAVLTEGLLLSVQYAYLDSEVTDVINPFTNAPDNNKYQLPSAPDRSYTVNLDYTGELTAIGEPVFNLGYSWRDDSVTSAPIYATPGSVIEEYKLINARFSLRAIPVVDEGELTVSLWGKNLGDEEYLVDSVGAFSWSSRTGAFGTPRTYGIDIQYKY